MFKSNQTIAFSWRLLVIMRQPTNSRRPQNRRAASEAVLDHPTNYCTSWRLMIVHESQRRARETVCQTSNSDRSVLDHAVDWINFSLSTALQILLIYLFTLICSRKPIEDVVGLLLVKCDVKSITMAVKSIWCLHFTCDPKNSAVMMDCACHFSGAPCTWLVL